MMHRSLSQLARHVIFFAKYTSTISTVLANYTFMAAAKMGHRHSRAIDSSTRKLQIYVVVAMEDFTKWIEAKPLVNIAATGLKRFFWQNIMCHFGVPRKIPVDNGKQFDCHICKDFYYQMGVEVAFASVYHPQSNGAMEKANTLIFIAIKEILEDQLNGKWAEELPRAVWSHNTSICRAMKFTPFKLLYGEEPVTPGENQAPQCYNKDGGYLQS
jgi:hypothetical protein